MQFISRGTLTELTPKPNALLFMIPFHTHADRRETASLNEAFEFCHARRTELKQGKFKEVSLIMQCGAYSSR